MMPKDPEIRLYVGTYTETMPHVRGQAEGIYVYRFNSSSGGLTRTGQCNGIRNPSYLAVAPQGRCLYAVQETPAHDGPAIHAFAVRPETGALTHLNQQPVPGGYPCHIQVDPDGRYALVASYLGGNVAVFPILEDGRLGAATDVVQHQGSGTDPRRQEGPHPHAVVFDAVGRVFVPDLGLDKIYVYRLDRAKGRLVPHDPPAAEVPSGAGPRHLGFHPNGRHAFVINEINSTLTAFAYDAGRGILTPRQTAGALPPGFDGESAGAAVRVSPSGRFVYGSNRGHDSIALFAFDEREGALTAIGHEPTRGKTPRDFIIDPSGQFLLAANQDTGTIAVFRIDPRSGRLQPTGEAIPVPTPVCLQFALSPT